MNNSLVEGFFLALLNCVIFQISSTELGFYTDILSNQDMGAKCLHIGKANPPGLSGEIYEIGILFFAPKEMPRKPRFLPKPVPLLEYLLFKCIRERLPELTA